MPDPDRLIGMPLFGGYRVTRKIGEGGMGAVYIAENSELQKRLAVKVLLPDRLSNPTATKRFLAEARAASAINHRNIIEIIDSAKLADGRHYILMEYLEGTTLRRYSRGLGPMPVDVSLAILSQVCSGLQAAHERGIVHRDLKPSNIFIAPQPDNPYFTKVLDFGIAKLEDPGLAGDVETKSQTVAGTPNYMSPEQARALRDVDHRTDIYSLGVIAYELLSGRLPYKAESIGDLVYQQASTRPPPLSRLRSDLPRGWAETVHAAISLEPDTRPRSAIELAHGLIRSTPNGEQIARATASLLFAPTSGSDLSSPSGPLEALGSSDWSQASMPAGPPRSMTESVADDARFVPQAPDQTKAASPAAIAQSGSDLQDSAAPAPSQTSGDAGSPGLGTDLGYPPPPGPSTQDLGPISAQDPDAPTTLGMSASQMSSPAESSGSRRALIVLALIVGAGLGGAALFFFGHSQGSSASDEVTPEQRPSTPSRPVVKPLANPADAAPEVPAADPADAGAVEAAADAVDAAADRDDRDDRDRKRPRRPKKPRDDERPSDDELFDGRK